MRRNFSFRPLLNIDNLIRTSNEVSMESKRERRYLVEVTALTLGLHTNAPQVAD